MELSREKVDWKSNIISNKSNPYRDLKHLTVIITIIIFTIIANITLSRHVSKTQVT